jgi:hypothetical protein
MLGFSCCEHLLLEVEALGHFKHPEEEHPPLQAATKHQ